MTATYTFDIFSSIDGFGSYDSPGDWGGYWGKQGPELLDHRLATYGGALRMVFGATTYRAFADMLAASSEGDDVRDPWVERMRTQPTYGRTGVDPVLGGAPDLDLELLESSVLDGRTTELVYRPTLRTWPGTAS